MPEQLQIHAHDAGTAMDFYFEDEDGTVDISSASTKQIKFEGPDGTTATKSFTLISDGEDGGGRYVKLSTDFNSPGEWTWQAKVVLSDGTFHSTYGKFQVYPDLFT